MQTGRTRMTIIPMRAMRRLVLDFDLETVTFLPGLEGSSISTATSSDNASAIDHCEFDRALVTLTIATAAASNVAPVRIQPTVIVGVNAAGAKKAPATIAAMRKTRKIAIGHDARRMTTPLSSAEPRNVQFRPVAGTP